MKRHMLIIAVGLLLAVPPAAPLAAQVASRTVEIGFDVHHRVQQGVEKPTFAFQTPVSLANVEVVLQRRGAPPIVESFDSVHQNERRTIEIDQPAGTFHYEARISGTDHQGETLTFQLDFDVITVEAIEAEVIRTGMDLLGGRLSLRVNRPIDRIEIEVADEEGTRQVQRTESFGGQYGTLALSWPAQASVGSVRLILHDVDGFWTGLLLEPFWIEIPHQSVNFETGLASFDEESEGPKLRETLSRLRQVMSEHGGGELEMQLYVAGYTDTVGSAESNRILSARRARAIARWFQQNGVEIPIFYQGFGEDALAVPTEDDVDEPRNRRALYILGNAPPPISHHIPRSDWERVW